jgi:hypothetical protein
MATPAFAGMTALMWRFVPNLTADEISAYMLGTATGAGTGQPNTTYGYGYVNPVAAYAKLKSDFAYLTAPAVTASTVTSRTTGILSWGAVSGRGVSYDVSVDGARVASGTTGLTLDSPLSNGVHEVAVTPRSSYNWTNGVATTVSVEVDTVAPTLSGLTYDAGTGLITWSSSEAGKPSSMLYRIDGGAASVLAGASYDPRSDGITSGAHTFYLQVTDAAGNPSAWASVVFGVTTPPSAPAITSAASSLASAYRFTWTAVTGATAYDIRVAGVLTASLTGLGSSVTLEKGDNLVEVRSRNSVGASAWSTRTVTFTPPLPATPKPVPSATETIENMVSVGWPSVPGAVGYDIQTNDGSVTTTQATSVQVVDMVRGANTLKVRSRNAYSDTSDWVAVTVTYAPPVVYTISDPKITPVVYGGTAVITASLSAGSGYAGGAVPVTLEQSGDGVAWSSLATGTTTALGVFTCTVSPTRVTYYRLNCAGTVSVVRESVKPLLTTPSAPASHDRHAFTVTGYLKPGHTAGAINVRIKAYLRNTRTGHYELKKTFSVRNIGYAGYTRYTGSIALSTKGTWRLYADYAATSAFDATTSGYRTVKIK